MSPFDIQSFRFYSKECGRNSHATFKVFPTDAVTVLFHISLQVCVPESEAVTWGRYSCADCEVFHFSSPDGLPRSLTEHVQLRLPPSDTYSGQVWLSNEKGWPVRTIMKITAALPSLSSLYFTTCQVTVVTPFPIVRKQRAVCKRWILLSKSFQYCSNTLYALRY